MTRIAFVGDVHVANHKKFGGLTNKGINERCENVLYALSSAAALARTQEAETLVILGDLFDTPRPSPQIVKRVQEIVETIPTVVLAGNHDQCSDEPGDNALAPLYPVAEVLDAPDVVPVGDVDLLMVPYLSGDYTKRLGDEVATLVRAGTNEKRKRILCFHAGIVGDKTPFFLKESSASISKDDLFTLSEKHLISVSLAGHWHTAETWQHNNGEHRCLAVQAGALAPTGFGDQGVHYGNMYIFDSGKDELEYHRVPGPRFIDVTLDQDITSISQGREDRLKDCRLYVRINVDETEISLGETIIKAGVDANAIEDGELSINSERMKEACEKAAKATQSSETLEEALAEYTTQMVVKGVDALDIPEARLEILAKALECLRKSGAD